MFMLRPIRPSIGGFVLTAREASFRGGIKKFHFHVKHYGLDESVPLIGIEAETFVAEEELVSPRRCGRALSGVVCPCGE